LLQAGLELAIARGWLVLRESGTYVKFTGAGAELFCLMATGWHRRFDDQIPVADGTELVTLREAVAYLAKTVPKAEQDMPSSGGSRDTDSRG
jgi:hypothetical protein